MTRNLIVNADDFGQAPGINAGVIQAYELGIVTSASLMVRWPAAEDAAAYARADPGLSVGLHVDMGEWVYDAGGWRPLYHVVDTDDRAAVAAELAEQLERFTALMGRSPTHIDSHQHVHRQQPLRTLVSAAARRLGVPVRQQTRSITYRGDFYGQSGQGEPYPAGIAADALHALLRDLPEGWTELGCHPGTGEDDGLIYGRERAQELTVLCDPVVAATLQNAQVQLRSFHDLVTVDRAAAPVAPTP